MDGALNTPQALVRAELPATPARRGALAEWQVQRVIRHIGAHLDTRIGVHELAVEANLSRPYFSRAFARTFGQSPHAYICRRRIERAQRLMLHTPLPLGQIAAECGLTDQSHLNRLFRRFVGRTPAAWRRAQIRKTEPFSAPPPAPALDKTLKPTGELS